MELKYILMTIIKILISVPALGVFGAALIGGHINNTENKPNSTSSYYDYIYDNLEFEPTSTTINTNETEKAQTPQNKTESVPDPSALVLPGYNLPENIFNHGKPFYLERDPLTGSIDFNSKSPEAKLSDDDLYEYTDEEPSSDIYDKANIDRKDGPINGKHKPNDVNQLTPNLYDFLNLPVKYNPDKYVYPLISSSYANTKVQGNVNKHHNHKEEYSYKASTFKPTISPTYYTTKKHTEKTTQYVEPSTTYTPTTTTFKNVATASENILNTPMNHPSFNDYEYSYSDERQEPPSVYQTTKTSYISTTSTTSTSKPISSTTKKVMSLFEQLFGDYDEQVVTTEKPIPMVNNLPPPKNKTTPFEEINRNEVKSSTTTTTTTTPSYINAHAGPNVLTGTNMGIDTYEYEEYDSETTQKSSENSPNKVLITSTPSYITPSKAESTTEARVTITSTSTTTEAPQPTLKVTSLPLGENHVTSNSNSPIIIATQNLRDQLNSEKVAPKPFSVNKNAPSTSSIHIAPDQDTVSFVMGHQQSVGDGQYVQGVGTALKESPYDSNPFRPLYGMEATYTNDKVEYSVQPPKSNPLNNDNDVYFTAGTSFDNTKDLYNPKPYRGVPEAAGSAVTIQPMVNSQASLSIGSPLGAENKIPGVVMDDKVELDAPEYPKGTGNTVVFPTEEKDPRVPPPPPQLLNKVPQQQSGPNREVLKLNSKPMYHQLPSSLTPPREKDQYHHRIDVPRPPWDPRPGHFHSGKPEYARPPRPPPEAYKRADNLPNILPQFRPNTGKNSPPSHQGHQHHHHHHHKHPPPHYHENRLNRQPLLERPSNRPIGFFEKLQPPPPPKNLHNLRKLPQVSQSLDGRTPMAEDRIIHEGPLKNPPMHQYNNFFQTPPKVITNRKKLAEGEVETLQMIQAKQSESKKEITAESQIQLETAIPAVSDTISGNKSESPVYVVYPVNTAPIKLDVIDTNKHESVVIGTRAESPLPPSKINQQEYGYEKNPILNIKDRNDAPILKPHPRPSFPIKSDFPYPLERPDSNLLVHPVPESNDNNLDTPIRNKNEDSIHFMSNNQWNTIENVESRIISAGNKNRFSHTEKPIAVAYTPTEPHLDDKYSMPNYGSPVIPEIRPGTVDNVDPNDDGEFTVGAVMHTHPQLDKGDKSSLLNIPNIQNHKLNDLDKPNIQPEQDFQAPFQASVSIDSANQGWSVIRDKASIKRSDEVETTTMPLATSSEFDIENFKPQLEGGFKPIYNYPSDDDNLTNTKISERQE